MKPRNYKGFTLVEVMVAMVIISIIVTVACSILFTALKARAVSREKLNALELSSSIIEEIKSYKGTDWEDKDELEAWLIGKGFVQNGNIFSKAETDSFNTSYNIEVSISVSEIEGLLDINASASSQSINKISLATRIRGE